MPMTAGRSARDLGLSLRRMTLCMRQLEDKGERKSSANSGHVRHSFRLRVALMAGATLPHKPPINPMDYNTSWLVSYQLSI